MYNLQLSRREAQIVIEATSALAFIAAGANGWESEAELINTVIRRIRSLPSRDQIVLINKLQRMLNTVRHSGAKL